MSSPPTIRDVLQDWINQADTAALGISPNGIIWQMNHPARELLNANDQEVTALKPWIHPEEWDAVDDVLASSRVSAFFNARVGPEGQRRHAIFDARRWGDDLGWLVTAVDVTAPMQRLREHAALVEAGYEDGWSTWAYYPTTDVHWHPAKTTELLSGIPADAPRTISHEDFLRGIHPGDRARLQATLSASFDEGRGYHTHYRAMTPDGTVRWFHSVGTVSHTVNDVPYLMGWILDVTRDREKMAQVAEQNRLRTMVDMARGLAHDFRNQLTLMGTYLDLVELHDPQASDVEPLARQAWQTALKLASTLLQPTAAAGRPQWVSVQSLVGPSAAWARSQGMEMRVSLPADPPIWGDPTTLAQMLDNLIRNAVEASPGGSLIMIEGSADQNGLTLHITDQGVGIPIELQEHIFEPGVTTKPTGHGLGLATVHRIASGLGGTIQIQAQPNGGTCFSLWLPYPNNEL